uniref:Reverse transcriptase Ty1/copia-type domain-containing protein n=1 Tax=Trichuris muris TaxID=70415 RepID=A0A5S6Q7N9_TRIMR
MHFNWHLRHADVKGAYFVGVRLTEKIYMKLPEGYEHPLGNVAKLLRPIYGLKQSGRIWNETLTTFLQKNGFKRLCTSSCVYVNSNRMIVVVHVDDIPLFHSHVREIYKMVQIMKVEYDIHDFVVSSPPARFACRRAGAPPFGAHLSGSGRGTALAPVDAEKSTSVVVRTKYGKRRVFQTKPNMRATWAEQQLVSSVVPCERFAVGDSNLAGQLLLRCEMNRRKLSNGYKRRQCFHFHLRASSGKCEEEFLPYSGQIGLQSPSAHRRWLQCVAKK